MKATITKATIAVPAGLAILADAFLLFSMKISNRRHVNVIAIVTDARARCERRAAP